MHITYIQLEYRGSYKHILTEKYSVKAMNSGVHIPETVHGVDIGLLVNNRKKKALDLRAALTLIFK